MNATSVSDRLPEDRSLPEVPYDVAERTLLRRSGQSPVDSDTPPEHRLMIALLRDAIRCIEKYRHARDFRGKRLFEQDSQWVLSNDTGWIYAFARVCETLSLEPDAVRSALGLLPDFGAHASARAATHATPILH